MMIGVGGGPGRDHRVRWEDYVQLLGNNLGTSRRHEKQEENENHVDHRRNLKAYVTILARPILSYSDLGLFFLVRNRKGHCQRRPPRRFPGDRA